MVAVLQIVLTQTLVHFRTNVKVALNTVTAEEMYAGNSTVESVILAHLADLSIFVHLATKLGSARNHAINARKRKKIKNNEPPINSQFLHFHC